MHLQSGLESSTVMNSSGKSSNKVVSREKLCIDDVTAEEPSQSEIDYGYLFRK